MIWTIIITWEQVCKYRFFRFTRIKDIGCPQDFISPNRHQNNPSVYAFLLKWSSNVVAFFKWVISIFYRYPRRMFRNIPIEIPNQITNNSRVQIKRPLTNVHENNQIKPYQYLYFKHSSFSKNVQSH